MRLSWQATDIRGYRVEVAIGLVQLAAYVDKRKLKKPAWDRNRNRT